MSYGINAFPIRVILRARLICAELTRLGGCITILLNGGILAVDSVLFITADGEIIFCPKIGDLPQVRNTKICRCNAS